MKTVLVVMAFMQYQGWVPQYTQTFPTEKACLERRAEFNKGDVSKQKAVCLPKVAE